MSTDPRFATTGPLPLAEAAPITDDDIVRAMEMFGGSFVAGLGQLFHRADRINRERLKVAFPEYWTRYREIAEMKRAQVQA